MGAGQPGMRTVGPSSRASQRRSRVRRRTPRRNEPRVRELLGLPQVPFDPLDVRYRALMLLHSWDFARSRVRPGDRDAHGHVPWLTAWVRRQCVFLGLLSTSAAERSAALRPGACGRSAHASRSA